MAPLGRYVGYTGGIKMERNAESERDELHPVVLFAASPKQERTGKLHCNPEWIRDHRETTGRPLQAPTIVACFRAADLTQD